jgi:hypothetical protein
MRVPQVSDRLKEIPAQALRGVFAGIGQLLLITDKLRNKTPADADVPRARAPEPTETVPQEAVADTAADSVPAAQEAAEPVATEAPKTSRTPKTSRAPQTSADTQDSAAAGTAKTPRVTKARDFDKTGNVRLLGGADAAARTTGKTAKTGKAAEAGEAADISSPAQGGSPADATPAAGAGPVADADVAVDARAAAAAGLAADAGPVAEAAEGAGDPGAPLPNFDELSVPSLRARLRNLDSAQVRQMLEYEQAHAARPEVITMFERRIAKLEAEA